MVYNDDSRWWWPCSRLPQGVGIRFLGGSVAAARNLWAAELSEIAIYGREDGDLPFLLVLQYASGRGVKLGEFDSFEKAYEHANGRGFDPAEESAEEKGDGNV